jgi:SAM-dependent methyltransferase
MSTFDAASYWENRLRGNVALEKIGYLGLGSQYNQWLYRVRKAVFRRAVKSLNISLAESSVLDVGSGSGFYIQQWKALGAGKLTGLDLTTAAVEHLGAKFPDVTFHRADIGEDRELPAKGPYDIVSAFDVLFHIVDDTRYRRAIQNIHSLLRPGGVFLLSDVFVHDNVVPLEHFVSRPLTQAESVLRETGFEILGRRRVFTIMSAPLDSSSRIRRVMWGGLQRTVSKSEAIGFVVGALLCPLDVMLASISKEGPSTEIMICRKERSTDVPA